MSIGKTSTLPEVELSEFNTCEERSVISSVFKHWYSPQEHKDITVYKLNKKRLDIQSLNVTYNFIYDRGWEVRVSSRQGGYDYEKVSSNMVYPLFVPYVPIKLVPIGLLQHLKDKKFTKLQQSELEGIFAWKDDGAKIEISPEFVEVDPLIYRKEFWIDISLLDEE